MKREDYILALTTGFLAIPDEILNNAIQYFGQRFELTELKKPKAVSVGGQIHNEQPQSFVHWIKSLRKGNIKAIYTHYPSDISAEKLPPQVAAAFAGTQKLLLSIKLPSSVKTFSLNTLFSPQYEITPSQFIQLIDAQANAPQLWNRVAELVLESNKLNNRSLFPSAHIKSYLLNSPDATESFDIMVSQLFQEVQIECFVTNTPFRAPLDLKHLFYQSNFPYGEPDRETVFLYPVKDISATELLALVHAQPFKDEIWQGCTTELTQYPQPDVPPYEPKEWEKRLSTLNGVAWESVVHLVCRVICNICEERKVKPVIPAHLSTSFGPDEVEAKRAQARSKMANTQLFLESNKNPWELYLFQELQGYDPSSYNHNYFSTKIRLQEALERIAAFASQIQSPFEEAFLLASVLLSEEMPEGNYDEAHLKSVNHLLKKKRFTNMAIENMEQSLLYAQDWVQFHWPQEKINGLLAVSIADVFGGMGSWNDIYVEDYETYEKVSSETFNAIKKYFASVLSSNM